MDDQPRYPDTSDKTGSPDRGSPPRAPRWVWVSAIVVGVLILVAAVLMLFSGGQHGPGRHMSSGGAPMSGSTEPVGAGSAAPFASAHG